MRQRGYVLREIAREVHVVEHHVSLRAGVAMITPDAATSRGEVHVVDYEDGQYIRLNLRELVHDAACLPIKVTVVNLACWVSVERVSEVAGLGRHIESLL